jgi:hypothetical protein
VHSNAEGRPQPDLHMQHCVRLLNFLGLELQSSENRSHGLRTSYLSEKGNRPDVTVKPGKRGTKCGKRGRNAGTDGTLSAGLHSGRRMHYSRWLRFGADSSSAKW